jgi:hypothetical protein
MNSRKLKSLQPLIPSALYPLPVLPEHAGLGETCIARLRRAGLRLPVIRVGRRCFVEGAAAIEFVRAAGELDARAGAAEDTQ